MGRNVQIALMMLLLTIAGAQAQTNNGIKRWSVGYPLQWTDFNGKPDSPESIYAAATYAGLELDVAEISSSRRVKFRVRAVFDSRRSWAHPDRKDDHLLAHEQLHFDIAEVYARKLERKLNSMQLKVKDKEIAKKLVQKYNQVQMQEQERFDKECFHGLDREKQLGWRTNVDKELRIKRPKPVLVAKE